MQENYKKLATESRVKCLELVYKAQTSHIGSLFSCADIFAVLFSKIDLDKDKFVLSKGWAACMLYFHLWKKGRITEEELNSYCKDGSKFIGLAEPIIPDIQIAGGSMGLGFPGAVGLALAKKFKGEAGTVYCLMSDGEMQIGTTWEAALIAGQHKLDNLVVVVDNNGFQAMGKISDVLNVGFPSGESWTLADIDGHDFVQMSYWFTELESKGKPRCFIANTIKGKGVSFMENDNIWHYKAPEKEEYERALACLQ